MIEGGVIANELVSLSELVSWDAAGMEGDNDVQVGN